MEEEAKCVRLLQQDIYDIFERKEFADIVFLVHGESFKAHKLILAARCSGFAWLLKLCESETIIVDEKNITKAGFEAFLRFFYTDYVDTSNRRVVIDVYLAALHYGQKSLQTICKEAINSWNITDDEVLNLLEAGANIPAVKDKCIGYIRNKAQKIISSPTFLLATFETLRIILKSRSFENLPAIERIKWSMKWAENLQPAFRTYSFVRDMFLKSSPTLLGMLGFETLSLTELRDVVHDYPELITPKEITDLLKYEKTKDVSILPRWCSYEQTEEGLNMDSPISITDDIHPGVLNHKHLQKDIWNIYESKDFVDVTFLVQGEEFKAHKFVLSVRCPGFKYLFEQSDIETIIVDEKSVTKSGFQTLIQFLYTDSVGITDKYATMEAYFAALYYRQKSLQTVCEEKIKHWIITADEVFQLLDVGADIPAVRKKSMNFIRNNPAGVLYAPSFLAASFKSLSTVLEDGAFENIPAMARIKQFMKWAETQKSDSETYSNVRNMFLTRSPTLLSMMNFEELDLTELRDVECDFPDLITPEEITSFMKYTKLKEPSFLPKWCQPDPNKCNA